MARFPFYASGLLIVVTLIVLLEPISSKLFRTQKSEPEDFTEDYYGESDHNEKESDTLEYNDECKKETVKRKTEESESDDVRQTNDDEAANKHKEKEKRFESVFRRRDESMERARNKKLNKFEKTAGEFSS